MEKSLTTDDSDIATEQYKGPSATVAAVGQGAIEHFLYAIVGLVSLGSLAFIFHKPATKFIEGARSLGTKLRNYSPEGTRFIDRRVDNLTTWSGDFLHAVFGDPEAAKPLRTLTANAADAHKEKIATMAMNKEQGFGNFLITHTVGIIPYVGKHFREYAQTFSNRTNAAIAVGGIAGLAGYVGGWLKAIFTGAKHGNKGKHQFERAQREIHALREKNEDLEKVNENLRRDYVAAASRLKDAESDKSEANRDEASIDAQAAKKETPTEGEKAVKPEVKKLDSAQHQGTLAPERAAELA